MKNLYLILLLLFFISCKKDIKKERSTKGDLNNLTELKLDIGLPKPYNDSLSLLSFMSSDSINYDKKILKIDYKKKLDSLYELMDEELNIIGFEDHFIEDARSGLDQLKKSYILDQSAAEFMWGASYGTNYRAYRIDENAFKRIEQMIYKRRYEELLIFNYHLRTNLTRWWEDPNTFLYRKRLKDVMPKKVMDSMYPKKKKRNRESTI
ncbi:hypothetical protein [Flavobacterium collinsii]|uniref:DUF4296 domain-containing protein n=1 Tax=Flavobacterium collinsii TaxID=1114861 RepID=A0ABN7ELH4_9FLAO|nr:hypothetical protein [Flavobacterium collinsii]CAA9199991.1 hypothetical protein FLACOL7796_02990 [Flavobacterium collinsii]